MVAIRFLIIALGIVAVLYYFSIALHFFGFKIYPFKQMSFFKAMIPYYYLLKYLKNLKF